MEPVWPTLFLWDTHLLDVGYGDGAGVTHAVPGRPPLLLVLRDDRQHLALL